MYDVYVTTTDKPEVRVNIFPYTKEEALDSAQFQFSYPNTVFVRIERVTR